MQQKRASELNVGDKILGLSTYYTILGIRYNSISGVMFPIIDIVDSFGRKRSIDTGCTPHLQDHIYEVE